MTYRVSCTIRIECLWGLLLCQKGVILEGKKSFDRFFFLCFSAGCVEDIVGFV